MINSVAAELRTRRPILEEFALQFRNLSYSVQNRSNALLRYVLVKISEHERLQFDVEIDRLTIEHLHPKSSIDENWSSEVVNSIGNLILLSDARNSILDDKPFAQKHTVLQSWGTGVPAFVLNHPEWSPDLVQKRTQTIAETAYMKIWSI